MSLCHNRKVVCGFIRTKPTGFGRLLVTLDNLPDRMALRRRRIFQVSALSTDVGEVFAHHGVDG